VSRSARAVLVALLVIVGAGVVLAQEAPGDVMYSGDLVLRYRGNCGDVTPEQRAVMTQQAIVEAISAVYATENEIFDPKSVTVKSVHCKACRQWTKQIVMGKIVLATVCVMDAKANKCCTQQLAARWLKNIRGALAKATHDC